MNIHTNAKIKQFLLNVVLILLAFTIQNCVFPLLPFLAATPNLLLILTFSFGFIHGKGAGMLYGVLSGLLLDLFYSGPFGFYTLAYIYIGYINGIFTRYYYEDYITLPLILSVFNELAYSMYVYVFRFLIRGRLDHAAGDHFYSGDHAFGLPAVLIRQQTAGRYGKKERLDDCLAN